MSSHVRNQRSDEGCPNSCLFTGKGFNLQDKGFTIKRSINWNVITYCFSHCWDHIKSTRYVSYLTTGRDKGNGIKHKIRRKNSESSCHCKVWDEVSTGKVLQKQWLYSWDLFIPVGSVLAGCLLLLRELLSKDSKVSVLICPVVGILMERKRNELGSG